MEDNNKMEVQNVKTEFAQYLFKFAKPQSRLVARAELYLLSDCPDKLIGIVMKKFDLELNPIPDKWCSCVYEPFTLKNFNDFQEASQWILKVSEERLEEQFNNLEFNWAD